MHVQPGTDLIILEFELEDDTVFPLKTPLEVQYKGGMNVEPFEPTEDDLAESTTKESKPLRLLKRRQQRNKSPMEHFSILSQVNEQLAGATDLKTFVKIVVGVFKEITGFHRVMVYQVSPI
jgi:light-regulated signal transduction histidine kinase (bacteriophytochrome)